LEVGTGGKVERREREEAGEEGKEEEEGRRV
jgi:hypothetical protein